MIVWFSGTGNSRLVAERLAERFGEDLLRIDADYPQRIQSAGSQKRIIWVCPVYGWRVPPVVENAVRQMPQEVGRQADHWLVVTCGDDVGETPRYWRKLLAGREWRSCAVFSVQMPNTYVFLPGFNTDSPEVVSSKLNSMPDKVDSISRAISGNEYDVDWVCPGAFPAIKSRVLWHPFHRWLMQPSGFHVSAGQCIGCGKCVRICPMKNIKLSESDRLPQWGSACAFCTACYQICPSHAVIYGIWSKNKGQQIIMKKENL